MTNDPTNETEGRGAAAWAILATLAVGAAIAALTIYATVVLAAAH